MKQMPTCPNCGSPMWRVVVEDSVEATSHFECVFQIGELCSRRTAGFRVPLSGRRVGPQSSDQSRLRPAYRPIVHSVISSTPAWTGPS